MRLFGKRKKLVMPQPGEPGEVDELVKRIHESKDSAEMLRATMRLIELSRLKRGASW